MLGVFFFFLGRHMMEGHRNAPIFITGADACLCCRWSSPLCRLKPTPSVLGEVMRHKCRVWVLHWHRLTSTRPFYTKSMSCARKTVARCRESGVGVMSPRAYPFLAILTARWVGVKLFSLWKQANPLHRHWDGVTPFGCSSKLTMTPPANKLSQTPTRVFKTSTTMRHLGPRLLQSQMPEREILTDNDRPLAKTLLLRVTGIPPECVLSLSCKFSNSSRIMLTNNAGQK